MQVFATDPDPQVSAMVLDDRRLDQLCLSTAYTSSNPWIGAYHISLCAEYAARFGGPHSSLMHIYPDLNVRLDNPLNTSKDDARSLDFTFIDDAWRAARAYLRARWINDAQMPTWTNREKPEWYDDGRGLGSEYQYIACHVRCRIGFVRQGEEGGIDCIRCGSVILYSCPKRDNYVNFSCDAGNCLEWEEEPL